MGGESEKLGEYKGEDSRGVNEDKSDFGESFSPKLCIFSDGNVECNGISLGCVTPDRMSSCRGELACDGA